MNTIPRRTIHLHDGELADMLRVAFDPPLAQAATVAGFEDAFTRHAGGGLAIPVGSGRLGLRLILKGLGIGAGHEVIVPAFTDESVPEAVRAVGARPVFVDVDRASMNLTAPSVEAAVTPNTRAVLATHIFGNPCDIKGISQIAAKSGVALIEDCAHAIEARVDGQMCGTFGVAAIFSFVVTKAINTFGGGMVLTQDARLAASIRESLAGLPMPEPAAFLSRVAAAYGLRAATSQSLFGVFGGPVLRTLRAAGTDVLQAYDRLARPATVNAQVDTAFSPIQAAAGLPQLRRIEETQGRRRHAMSRILGGLPTGITAQARLPGSVHAAYFLVVTTADPDRLTKLLLRHGVDAGRHPMRNVSTASPEGPSDGATRFPNAEYLYQHAVQIPIHPELDDDAIEQIRSALSGA